MGIILSICTGTLVTVNIKKTRESQSSVLLKILVNYLQIMAVTLSFGMRFPDIVLNMFFPIRTIGSSSGVLISFDCLKRQADFKLFTPSSLFLKALMAAILPIILFIGIIIVFSLLHLIFPKRFTDFKRNILVSFISLIFLLHPPISRTAFQMFQ